MLLKGNTTNPQAVPQAINESLISTLITHSQYAEAWRLLSACNNPNTAGFYNLTLCLMQAEEYEQALIKADETFCSLQKIPSYPTGKESETEKILHTKQHQIHTHLTPVIQEYAEKFPDILKESVLRLKIDCYRATGHWNKVIETATKLTGKEYRNVQEALHEAENKLK